MRHFTCSGLSTSAVLLLALAGCNPPAPHLVDSGPHITPDMGTTPPTDTNPMGQPDMHVTTVDMGTTSGLCGFGPGGCDLLAASACPNDGSTRQGCYLSATGTMCAPAGTATSGTCMNSNGCDRGYVCVGDSSGSTCEHACCADTDCGTGEICNPIGDGSGNALPNNIGYCHRPTACTPVPNAGCGAMEQCNVVAADGTTDCLPTGTGAEGATCGGSTGVGCAAGLGCYGPASGAAMCVRLCRIGMDSDCMAAHPTCTASGLGSTYGLCN